MTSTAGCAVGDVPRRTDRCSRAAARRFVDGDDVLTWFDLHTEGAAPAPTGNWMHVEGGPIRTGRVTFDPRPLLGSPRLRG